MAKPEMCNKCYECKHRREVPGSAHSECAHPKVPELPGMLGLLGIMATSRVGPLPMVRSELNVEGAAHGRRNGWFNWPMDFDPVWLEKCDGFEAKESGAK